MSALIEQDSLTDPGNIPVVATPATLLAMAVKQGADIDKLEKLMELQTRWENREAQKSYVSAMSRFRAACPTIAKTRTAHNSKYAGLAETIDQIKPLLADNGLSHAWKTDQSDGYISVTCCITHVQGHSECTTLSAGSDDSGKKNDIQAMGSTVTYLSRYTLYAILGLASGDDDGASTGEPVEAITEDQCLTIESLISDNDLDKDATMAYLKKAFNLDHIDELPANKYRAVIRTINVSVEAKRNADT